MLVCHPGGPGFSSFYFGDLAGLAERCTVVLLNPRGTDGSTPPADPQAYRIEDYVADLDELRLHLGLGRMRLLGHSHGGAVAYASTHPGRVERLVLASTLARFGEPPFYFARWGDAGQRYAESFQHERPDPDALRLVRGGTREAVTGSPSAEPGLPGGSHNAAPARLLPNEGARGGTTGSPTLDTGHFLFVEAPERFRSALEGFLAA